MKRVTSQNASDHCLLLSQCWYVTFSILVLRGHAGFDFGSALWISAWMPCLPLSLLLLFPKIVLLPVVWTALLSTTSDIVCIDFSRLYVDRIGCMSKQPSSHANRWWNMLNTAYKLHNLMYLCIPLFVIYLFRLMMVLYWKWCGLLLNMVMWWSPPRHQDLFHCGRRLVRVSVLCIIY